MNGIVDTSVFCGYWPFRNLSHRSSESLKTYLQARGVCQAWVTATEAILLPDPMQGNEPLFEALSGDRFWAPVAVIDPTLATWHRDASTCLEKWACRAFKLLPNYRPTELLYPRVADLVQLATEAGVPVCVQLRMMDERSHHPLMKVPAVPPGDLVALAQRHPEARFLACGAFLGDIKTLARASNIWVELSLLESGQPLHSAVGALGPDRVVFGSHSPFLYFEAVAAKLDVDPQDVAPEVVEAVREHNAMLLLGEG